MGNISSIPVNQTFYFKDLEKGPDKYGHWTAGDKDGNGKPVYRDTWAGGAINAYNDSSEPTYVPASEFRTVSGSPDFIRLTNDTNKSVVLLLENGDSKIGGFQDNKTIVGIAYNDGRTLNEKHYLNRLDTRQAIRVTVPVGATVYWGRTGTMFSAYYSYKLEEIMTTHTVNTLYSGVTKYPEVLTLNDILYFNPTSTGRSGTIMKWIVPMSGKYQITAAGAQGGKTSNSSLTARGGYGAIASGKIELKQGDVIQVLVGQQGMGYPQGGGGGGGSFVARGSVLSSTTPLIVGGGGGGGSNNNTNGYGRDGSTSISGSSSYGSSTPYGGSSGQGGRSVPAGTYPAGSGGGFYGDGQSVEYATQKVVSWGTANGKNNIVQGGQAFINGGLGGYARSDASVGGFGGGGGNGNYPGGGGGGYSGGGGGYNDGYGGGGGGSYISGENTSVTTGKSGDGYVKIQLVELGSMPPTVPTNLKVTASANSVYLTGETITVSWNASTDPEGDAITYDVDFYNGSSWVSVASKITDVSVEYKLPDGLNITNAKIRVRAVDNNTAASTYQESAAFTVRKQLLLIEDGEVIKTYKDGDWISI
ncbi:fibronectin type III domain-containing protein [Bacillus thuringiensis]|uniref:fibronectin type III domain-containing protein n=1 Tax=Bacillus thuringiensis TaxID=1428 RepID=UPI00366A6C09